MQAVVSCPLALPRQPPLEVDGVAGEGLLGGLLQRARLAPRAAFDAHALPCPPKEAGRDAASAEPLLQARAARREGAGAERGLERGEE